MPQAVSSNKLIRTPAASHLEVAHNTTVTPQSFLRLMECVIKRFTAVINSVAEQVFDTGGHFQI
jgi:hypothetical protein